MLLPKHALIGLASSVLALLLIYVSAAGRSSWSTAVIAIVDAYDDASARSPSDVHHPVQSRSRARAVQLS